MSIGIKHALILNDWILIMVMTELLRRYTMMMMK
jgi:hypothetical protein